MSRGKLKAEDEECIIKNYVYLKENLDALKIVDDLFQHDVINLEDKEKIVNAESKLERNEILLNALLNAGPGDAYKNFLRCLEKDNLFVADILHPNGILPTILKVLHLRHQAAKESQQEERESIIKALVHASTSSNWKTIKPIGFGAFSEVFTANIETQRGRFEIAVKQIKTTQETQDKYKKSAEIEINTLKKLSHERIVSYYGFQSDGFSFYLFMENMKYGSLSNFIHVQTKGALSDVLLKMFTKQILKGLQYLHKNRIIHRDIKSDNVLMSDKENIKLADFGVSKTFGEISKATTQGVGTAKYMAPEVITQDNHSYPVDVWSTGCVVLEMAAGKRPFPGRAEPNVYYILMGDNPSPMTYSKVSKEVETFLVKMFHKDPTERPTCRDLLRDDFFKVSGAVAAENGASVATAELETMEAIEKMTLDVSHEVTKNALSK